MKKKNLLMTAIAIFGLATITMAQTVPSYVPTTGLVGWWPFNGNANDESSNTNNGTVNGATLTIDRNGISNSAFDFNGSNSIINCSNPSIPQNGTFSISFWVNPSSVSGVQEFFHQNVWPGAFYVGMNGGIMRCGDYWQNTGVSINALQWQNFIIVRNYMTNVDIYLNGTLQTSLGSDITLGGNATDPLVFGKQYGSNAEYYNGILDDIGIWNRALTQLEISALYNGCSASVTIQPISQSVNISNNAQFTTASSDPLATYQWQTDLGVGYQNLNSVGQYSGTANDTLTIANTTLSNNNQPFRCIVSSGSCSDTSNVAILTVNNNVGINEFTQDNLFSVYPNPAKSQINVKADAKLLGSIYTVYDNTGKLVLSGKIISENTTIELGNLSGGIYLFRVGENLKQTFKVIKE